MSSAPKTPLNPTELAKLSIVECADLYRELGMLKIEPVAGEEVVRRIVFWRDRSTGL